MSDRDNSGVLWFLAGLGIGGVVGLLYAPKAGDDLRSELRERASQGRDMVTERARQTREQAAEWMDRGKETLNQQKDRIRSAVDAGFQTYREAAAATEPEDVAPGV